MVLIFPTQFHLFADARGRWMTQFQNINSQKVSSPIPCETDMLSLSLSSVLFLQGDPSMI